MIYVFIILFALAAAAAGYLAWRLKGTREALARAETRCRNMQKDRAIRQNLQHILDSREAEVRRLKAKLRQNEADAQELESRASELNLTLFRESGLRILAEKEDGAKRMKMDQLERQLEEAGKKLARAKEEASKNEQRLRQTIEAQQAEIDRLNAARARRAAKRVIQETGLDQVTLDDILSSPEGKP